MFPLLDFSENIAIITDNDERLTYKQLFQETEEFKAHLPKWGVICCLCKNKIGSLIGYVSGICNGYPLILLDGGRDAAYCSSYFDQYLPEYVWMPSDRVSEICGNVLYERFGYSLVEVAHRSKKSLSPINHELSLCLTTSGSTGSPKLVRLTLENIRSNAESIAEYLKIDEKERPITTLPMYYSFGLSVINSHLIKGATILLTDSTVFSSTFWNFFKRSFPTSIAGVPFTYEMLERMGFFKMDLPSLKTMIQAGGKLNVDIIKKYLQFAQETERSFIVMYGQTEAGPRMSYLPFETALQRPSSIGIPIPGGRFEIIDTDGKLIDTPDVDGELVFKGPSVCMGYAESRSDLDKGDENRGVLRTGDVAHRDAEGYYYITGRLKRFVKIWGNRYNLDAIEQLLKPITTDSACVGDDSKIYVFIEDPAYIDAVTLMLQKKLQLEKSCFSVKVIQSIPKSASGKIQYSLLKDAALAHTDI